MVSYADRRFSPDEVSAIVRHALAGRVVADTIGYEELLETAEELNIPVERLQAAIAVQDKEGKREAAREKFMRRRRRAFNHHLRAYLVVNGALVVINLLSSGGFHELWFVWPMVGWGIGLAFHATSTFFLSDEDIDRSIKRELRRERRREAAMEREVSH